MKHSMTIWGIGLKFVLISILLTVLAVTLNYGVFPDLIFCIGNRLLNTLVGIVLIAVGIFALLIPAQIVTKYFNEKRLCTAGIYAYIRHPIYAAWILTIIPGMVIISGSLFGIFIPFFMYVIFKIMIREEEEYLKMQFGKDYLEYQQKVGAIFPKIKY